MSSTTLFLSRNFLVFCVWIEVSSLFFCTCASNSSYSNLIAFLCCCFWHFTFTDSFDNVHTDQKDEQRKIWHITKVLGKNRTRTLQLNVTCLRHHLIFMYMPLKLPPIISQISKWLFSNSHASYWAEQLLIKALCAVWRPCTNWAVDVLPCCTVMASVHFSTI